MHLQNSFRTTKNTCSISNFLKPEEAYEVLTKGWTNRRVASTNMNRESSRSHSLFTLHLETKSKEEDGVIRTKVNVTRNPCQTLNVYSICY